MREKWKGNAGISQKLTNMNEVMNVSLITLWVVFFLTPDCLKCDKNLTVAGKHHSILSILGCKIAVIGLSFLVISGACKTWFGEAKLKPSVSSLSWFSVWQMLLVSKICFGVSFTKATSRGQYMTEFIGNNIWGISEETVWQSYSPNTWRAFFPFLFESYFKNSWTAVEQMVFAIVVSLRKKKMNF